MVSAPALILGLLVIVIGFLIVPSIIDGQDTVTNQADHLQCTLNEGICKPEGECAEENIVNVGEDVCGEASTCCKE